MDDDLSDLRARASGGDRDAADVLAELTDAEG